MGIDLESPSFYRQILTYPLLHSEHGRAVRNAVLVFLSQIATVFGGIREWFEPSERWTMPQPSGEHRPPHVTSAIH